MSSAYLVAYGAMRHIGRFGADASAHQRGDRVVVRTPRGAELGEVLAPIRVPEVPPSPILRAAGAADLERIERFEAERPARLAQVEQLLAEGAWPIALVDVEALLDEGRLVVSYLGPRRLDMAGLRARLQARIGLDVLFEPVGRDEDEPQADHACGAGGCGSGGCGTDSGGCAGCAVKDLVRRRVPA
jgi:cell fate regulator YaaT (PSP1 superfamily)